MHVAGCSVFKGEAPAYDELIAAIESRLHLVPRYRQRLAFVPFDQGRPVWVDDPHFNVRYHVRHTALPRPGGDSELKRLAGRVFSQALDRSRPLWELWLVEGLAGDRFAVLSKTHHALVDGVSGVDIATVLFDTSAEPLPVAPPEHQWVARPLPTAAQLLADALLERARPSRARWHAEYGRRSGPAHRWRDAWPGDSGALARWPGRDSRRRRPARSTSGSVRTGGSPGSRPTSSPACQGDQELTGGTVNDVVLAAVVAGALGSYMRLHGNSTDGVGLRAMVPVSVRADIERGALGNRVAAMWATLPIGVTDPVKRLQMVSAQMQEVKQSGQAVGAEILTGLSGFAPPTIMAQAARLQARQRLFNLVVTNVPGPQFPLYLLGRELEAIYPMVPLAENTALGIAILSYNGQLGLRPGGRFRRAGRRRGAGG